MSYRTFFAFQREPFGQDLPVEDLYPFRAFRPPRNAFSTAFPSASPSSPGTWEAATDGVALRAK